MKRRGLRLLLSTMLLIVFLFPLPECYLTKRNCPRKTTSACPVLGGECKSGELDCGRGCPLSEARGRLKKSNSCCERLNKLKSYPFRSWFSLAPATDCLVCVAVECASAVRDSLGILSLSKSANLGERASPVLLRKQSFLF